MSLRWWLVSAGCAGLVGGVGCTRVDYVPLEGGAYQVDALNHPKDLQGITLDLDLAASEARLSDGASTVVLQLTRVPDRERWHGGCGTMSGHSMLEPVKLQPTSFELVGRTWRFDTIHADCGGNGLRMIEAANADGRWILRPR